MKVIYTIICAFIICTTINVNAQELILEGGKSITSFEFKDSQSNELGNLQATKQNYISVGYRGNLFNETISFVAGTGLHAYGAIGSDDLVNNYFEWETSYLSIYAGIDIQAFSANNFSFHIRGTLAPEFLIEGTQTINNKVVNLVGEEDFDKPILFVRGAASFEYNITETAGIFLQYRYGKSTPLGDNNLASKLKFTAHDIGLGLIIRLGSKNSEEEITQPIEN